MENQTSSNFFHQNITYGCYEGEYAIYVSSLFFAGVGLPLALVAIIALRSVVWTFSLLIYLFWTKFFRKHSCECFWCSPCRYERTTLPPCTSSTSWSPTSFSFAAPSFSWQQIRRRFANTFATFLTMVSWSAFASWWSSPWKGNYLFPSVAPPMSTNWLWMWILQVPDCGLAALVQTETKHQDVSQNLHCGLAYLSVIVDH